MEPNFGFFGFVPRIRAKLFEFKMTSPGAKLAKTLENL
jgi:hypothetical protein